VISPGIGPGAVPVTIHPSGRRCAFRAEGTGQPPVPRPLRGLGSVSLLLGETDEKPQSFVHGSRVLEHFRDIRVQEYNIRTLGISLVMLSPDTSGEVVFGLHVLGLFRSARFHIGVFREAWPLGH